MGTSSRVAVGLALCAVLLSACGEEASSAVDPFGDGTWLLVAGDVDGAPLILYDTHPVTLRADGDTVGGTSACNQYGGILRLDGAGVSIDEISMTEMACLDDGVMELEAVYLGALGRVDDAALEGEQLILAADGVRLRFDPVEPESDAALMGPTWELDTVVDGETASTPAAGAWIRFESDGTVTGHNGCNGFGGAYDPMDGFSDLVQTLIGCIDPIAHQESLFMGVLGSQPTLSIEGSRLTITAADGRALVFRIT
jgi:heat shock protein HslJ